MSEGVTTEETEVAFVMFRSGTQAVLCIANGREEDRTIRLNVAVESFRWPARLANVEGPGTAGMEARTSDRMTFVVQIAASGHSILRFHPAN